MCLLINGISLAYITFGHEVTPESVGVQGDARMIKISEVASSEELQFNLFVLHSFDLRSMLF